MGEENFKRKVNQKKISMVDLHGQYQRIKPEIDQAIQEVLPEVGPLLMARIGTTTFRDEE